MDIPKNSFTYLFPLLLDDDVELLDDLAPEDELLVPDDTLEPLLERVVLRVVELDEELVFEIELPLLLVLTGEVTEGNLVLPGRL